MPLPHFLMLLSAVIIGAAVTLWAAFAAGVPPMAFVLIALSAALFAHFGLRNNHDPKG
ncbi:hypothetical protein Q4511_03870 [Paracoccus sp. 1_MG-2023]|uniref:hypothetical protein n=1 Tax=unclassified Paracoccus (in: a-proteobacteria) TaxID=2688777 RepID=UPI001C0A03B3|nr:MULTISPECIES: hypothetical protein [unclassified Paracoccus (in: a-proteobacteria)]MBU2956374.1 hypothetical protein [Paracoccus sp. C2R09]MDO6668050.1 hypothetical protein [Paracoccus sp. 1_MG-2023]